MLMHRNTLRLLRAGEGQSAFARLISEVTFNTRKNIAGNQTMPSPAPIILTLRENKYTTPRAFSPREKIVTPPLDGHSLSIL